MKRFILFLIRKHLGVKKYEYFQFTNQKSNAVYYFADDVLVKYWRNYSEPSHVSLNWLLDSNCNTIKVGKCL